MNSLHRLRRLPLPWLAAAAAGWFLALAAPPTAFAITLWLGLSAFAVVLEALPSLTTAAPIQQRRWLRWLGSLQGVGRGVAFGTAVNLWSLSFIPAVVTRFTDLSKGVALLALLLLSLEQSLRWTLMAWVHLRLRRARVPLPLALAAGLYVSTFVPVMIPWTPSGGATLWPATVQLAEVVGERGVDVVMAITAGIFALGLLEATRKNNRRFAGYSALSLALFVAIFVHGTVRLAQIDQARAAAKHAKVALLAPAIEATLHEARAHRPVILEELESLTRQAEQQDHVDFSVWPEGSYPWPVQHESRNAPLHERAPLQGGIHGPVVSGLMTYDHDERMYNSATVFTSDGRMTAPYDKMHLLWFGETVPLAEEIPWIRRTFARGMGLNAGQEEVGLAVGDMRVAVLNCFEDTLPLASREAALVNPQILLNLTNDSWFSGTFESDLHMRIAGLRSVEIRRDLLRSVNGGTTSWYDAGGRLRATLSGDAPGWLTADAALLELPPTMYARYGELPMEVLLFAAVLEAILRGRRNAAPTSASATLAA